MVVLNGISAHLVPYNDNVGDDNISHQILLYTANLHSMPECTELQLRLTFFSKKIAQKVVYTKF